MIEADRLMKKYDKDIAVDNVTFTVNEAEIFGFLGPNGAGKTTTINMLTTLIPPTSGRALIAGFDVVKEQHHVRQNIGLVPQDLTSDPELTGMENISLQAEMYGMPKDSAKRKVIEMLDLVGLGEVAHRRVSTYSGGMRRRLEFAEGLIHSPKVLFLDEPTLGLDVQTRTVLWNYILKARDEMKLTVFVTTHYMEEADRYCDRVAIIHGGRLMCIDKPSKLKESLGKNVAEIVMLDSTTGVDAILGNLKQVLDFKKSGRSYVVTLSDEQEGLSDIFEAFGRARLKPEKISLLRPSLDSVFLKLTGSSIGETMESSDARRLMSIKKVRGDKS